MLESMKQISSPPPIFGVFVNNEGRSGLGNLPWKFPQLITSWHPKHSLNSDTCTNPCL